MGLHLSKIICFDLCHDLSTFKFCSIPFFGIKCCSIYLTSGRSRGRSVLQKTHPFYFFFSHIPLIWHEKKKKFHPVFCWNPVNLLNHLWRCQIFAPTVYLKTCFLLFVGGCQMKLASALTLFPALSALYICLSSKISDKDTERGVRSFSRGYYSEYKKLSASF